MVCFIVWYGPRVPRTSTGHTQITLHCFLTELKVATLKEKNFIILPSVSSYEYRLFAPTGLCRSIWVFLVFTKTRKVKGKNVMSWKYLCSVCMCACACACTCVEWGAEEGNESWRENSEFKNNVLQQQVFIISYYILIKRLNLFPYILDLNRKYSRKDDG